MFRGQADASWPLLTTLDRTYTTVDNTGRTALYEQLLEDFRRESLVLCQTHPEGIAFELLARHHGVPSLMIDWTMSQFIASYFALGTEGSGPGSSAAVWVFGRARFRFDDSGVDLIDDADLLRFKPRALRQRGVFMRVRTAESSYEEVLGNALTKITIPRESAEEAATHLDAMGINPTSLFADLDRAARTVRKRHSTPGGGLPNV